MLRVLEKEKRGELIGAQSTPLPLRLAVAGTGALLVAAPSQFCNHWPTDYNFWPQTLALLILCAIALCFALSAPKWPRMSGASAFLLAFGGWNFFATLMGVYKHDAWLELARVSGGLFLYFALSALHPRLTTLAICAVAGATIPALGALLDFFSTHNMRQQGGVFPLTFAFLNANLFAALLAPALALSVLLPLEAWRRTRSAGNSLLASIPSVILAIALALTSSKGGFIAAIAAGCVLLIALWRARGAAMGRSLKRAWPVVLVVVLVFGAVAAKTVGTRLTRARGADDNSTQFRAYLWRSTIDMAHAKPVLGFGPGSFPTVYPRFAQVGYTRTAHQSWLQIAAESGWPSLVLLLGAFALAVRDGWRKLKTPSWAHGACGMAALCAIFVHGFFDAGWSVFCVLALASVALALCVQQDEIQPSPERRGFNWPFLGATLVLLLGGYGTQQVASGEDVRAQAEASYRKGAPSPQLAGEATQTDSGSGRNWNWLGKSLPRDNREAWTAAFETAARVQPDSAAHPRDLARQIDALPAPTASDLKQVAALYDHAVELDPLNSSLRLERAKWRLDHKDGNGYDDLEFVLREWDTPYGKYPALGPDTDINLDFARATLMIAPRLKTQKQTARLQTLTKHALADCATARQLQRTNAAMLQALQGQSGVGDFGDLDALESGLRALK